MTDITPSTSHSAQSPVDALTAATSTIAWVIAANKPFYPLYVWWLVGDGALAACGTVAGAALFAAIPFLARRHPFAARVALPVIGLIDTVFAEKLFGQGAGTELYLAPCMLLVALSFRAVEKWWQRGLAIAIFLAFVAFHTRIGAPLYVWDTADVATLFTLNAFSVASLMTFITLRYAGVPRG